MNSEPNSEMLIIARELRGLSQKELAQATSISQPSISRYENGLNTISPDDLVVLAKVLDFPIGFFFREGRRYGVESGELFHRKQNSLPSADLARLQRMLDLFRLNLEILLQEITIKDFSRIPNYNRKSFQGTTDDVASMVRAYWGMPSGEVKNLMAVAREACIFVFAVDFGTDQIDELVQWVEPTPPVMLVNTRAPGDRLRFSIAHAIGHLVMHHYLEPYPEMEKEADAFAAAFLMPAEDILRDLREVSIEHMIQLKPKWQVSIQALIRRARDLGVISERRYTTLFERLSRAGYRKHEPFPLPTEEPILFKELWGQYETEGHYSLSDMAKLLKNNEHDLLRWYFPEKSGLRLVMKKRFAGSQGD